MNKLVSRARHKSRLNELSGYSIVWVLVKRVRVLLTYFWVSLVFYRVIQISRRHTKKAKNTKLDRNVLIIGGGKSANQIDVKKVLADQSANKLDVVAMNWYAISPLAGLIIPNFYVLTDPIFKPNVESILKGKSSKDVWTVLNTWKSTRFVFPNYWANDIDVYSDRVELFIDERELVGFTKNNSPEKPRGYCSLTSSKAIASALYMGYQRIYLVGYDSTNYQFRVDENNRIYEKAQHASDSADSTDLYVGDYFENGVSDLLYSYALIFLDMKRCFRSKNIFNIQSDSALDAFPKVEIPYLTWSLSEKN